MAGICQKEGKAAMRGAHGDVGEAPASGRGANYAQGIVEAVAADRFAADVREAARHHVAHHRQVGRVGHLRPARDAHPVRRPSGRIAVRAALDELPARHPVHDPHVERLVHRAEHRRGQLLAGLAPVLHLGASGPRAGDGKVLSAERAERNQDLVTVAQAIHWFDLEKFYAEAKRVLKPGGVIAAWTYTLLDVEAGIEQASDAPPALRLCWRETGGPPAARPKRRGFGSRLIERSIAGELRGRIAFDYGEDGLVVRFDTPLTRRLG